MLPLLATQLNSTLIWLCQAIYSVGAFNHYINDTQFLRGDQTSFRNLMIDIFLSNLIFLEPLNLFLYTWRLLDQLKREETNPKVKKFYQ